MTTRPKKPAARTIEQETPSKEGERSRPLESREQAVLEQAIEKASAAAEQHNDTWAGLGRWLFTHVFGEDSTAAIHHRDDNPIWEALYALADSAKVRVRHDDLEHAVLCAAYDKRLNHDGWRALDYERKWRLLRLEDERLLRKAAQHVLATSMDTVGIAKYVQSVLEENETPVPVRVSFPGLMRQWSSVSERVGRKGFLRQFEVAAKKLTAEQRERAVERIDEARAALDALREKLTEE